MSPLRKICVVVVVLMALFPQVLWGAGRGPLQIDRAEVERLRAAIPGRTIIVDWHGTWDYATIQQALDASADGDTIIVLPSAGSPAGAYVENVIFPVRAVTLRSVNPEDPAVVAATVIDGNAAGSVVRFAEGTPPEAALEGFTITNGSGMASGSFTYGGGLYLSSSSPTIANNTITGNSASRDGGGLYLAYCSPTITSNTLTCNGASFGGGGLHLYSSSATIANNTITGNSASYGGGLELANSSPTIANNTITGNSAGYGGGLHVSSSSPSSYSPTIANNTITGNSSSYSGGGLYLFSSRGTVANNRITGNSSSYQGGGLLLSYSFTTITNNTITGNSASSGGGALYLTASWPTIAGTILAFNSSGIHGQGIAPTLRHNCAYGNTAYNYSGLTDPTGTDGNISVAPQFVEDPASGPDGAWGTADDDPGDLHLLAVSPCINAGDNTAVSGDVDLDGNPRLVGCFVDMGAYEYQEVLPIRADFDDDCDVDLDDYLIFEVCLYLSGPGEAPAFQECLEVFDFDIDADLDLADFAVFQAAFGGP